MAAAFPRNRHLRAIVVAAPALGFAFDRARLRQVTLPVQLWQADDDSILPPAYYAQRVRAALPHAPDFHPVPHAGHFDFLAPCSPLLAHAVPAICTSAPGFDRAAFHQRMNADLVRFFQATLG
ncbi:alpha/beta hydrolase [Gluconacetobacter tumulisoli]|uniref:Uncharacterized protein n=1 Tax=Gluconacetobacter tumulisoli TaxID=1286189 RepID=A0A7W4K834_9PROT|nr:hypothetical protein [Gluconacetobacter tumulisoli]MBB2202114.1 hypothetical protein [Gluconacetobacter tumulisoli]